MNIKISSDNSKSRRMKYTFSLIVSICLFTAMCAIVAATTQTLYTYCGFRHNSSPPPISPLPEPTEEIEIEIEKHYSNEDAILLAKILYAECRGVKSKTQQACVVWTVLNRVDAGQGSIQEVATKPHQFAYRKHAPVTDELLSIAYDVLDRWSAEKSGVDNVGRVLPRNYTYFYGDGRENHFRDAYRNGKIWDYSLDSPYES